MLQSAGSRTPAPLIEIHRVCYSGSGPGRQFPDLGALEVMFKQALLPAVTAAKVNVEVFIWDDFHARYIVSDLIGILMENGFDTTAANVVTTWARLGRQTRDDVMREFDPASNRHVLRRRFRIP